MKELKPLATFGARGLVRRRVSASLENKEKLALQAFYFGPSLLHPCLAFGELVDWPSSSLRRSMPTEKRQQQEIVLTKQLLQTAAPLEQNQYP